MPRKAKPLEVSEDDIVVLEHMKSYEDSSISLRADIILHSIQNPDKLDKDIAEELNTTPQTVLKWKNSYRNGGIDALSPKKRGPHGKPLDKDRIFDDEIRELMDSNPEKPWTAKELASQLGISEDKVYASLRKQGRTLERKRSWSCATKDAPHLGLKAILGLYLCSSGQAIIIGDIPSNVCGNVVYGTMETHNRGLFEEAELSVVPLTLLDTLVHATEYPDKVSRSTGKTLSALIDEVLTECKNKNTSHVHLFIHGNDQYRDIRNIDVSIHHAESFDEFENILLGWTLKEAGPEGVSYMAKVLSLASEYLTSCGKEVEPYMWKLSYSASQEDEDDLSSVRDAPAAESFDSIEAALSGLFQEEGAEPKEMNKAIIVHRSQDGKVEYRVIDQTHESTIRGDFQTAQGFDQLVTSLDDMMTLFARDFNLAGRDYFMELVKKNKDH